MKNSYINYGAFLSLMFALPIHLDAEGFVDPDFRLAPHAPDDPAINTPPRAISEEERADPPPGEIRKLYLYEVNYVRAQYAATIAAAPDGPTGKDSPLMAKVQAIKVDLDKITKDRLQNDVFAFIPKMIELDTSNIDEEGTPQATYFDELHIILRDLSVGVLHAIAEHVMDQEGNVTAANLLLFTDTLSCRDFLSEHQWEEKIKPIDGAGIMIIDPSTVVSHLKTKPWQFTEMFQLIPDTTITDPFARYEASGDGIPALKAKYAANKATINAKWNELETWMKAQQSADPTYTAPSGE